MKWEYYLLKIWGNTDKPREGNDWIEWQKKFNSRGERGWELVNITNNVAIFKRPIPNTDKARTVPEASAFPTIDTVDEPLETIHSDIQLARNTEPAQSSVEETF